MRVRAEIDLRRQPFHERERFALGGAEVYGAVAPKANSQVRSTTYGVLRLQLGASSYSWKFLPVAGQSFTDSGTTACH